MILLRPLESLGGKAEFLWEGQAWHLDNGDSGALTEIGKSHRADRGGREWLTNLSRSCLGRDAEL